MTSAVELTAGDGTRLVHHLWRVNSAVGTVGLLPGLARHADQPSYAFLVDAHTQGVLLIAWVSVAAVWSRWTSASAAEARAGSASR